MKKILQPGFFRLTLLAISFLALPTLSSSAIEFDSTPNSIQIPLRIMTYNILRGGKYGPIEWTVNTILQAKAHIIGIQESDGKMAVLASRLGFYFDESAQILSRFPISKSLPHGGVKIRLSPNQEIAVFNVHLPAFPYGPHDLRDGESKETVLKREHESGRVENLAKTLIAMKSVIFQGIPVFLVGDFNAPSHLDWTERNRSIHFNQIVPWPTSQMVTQLGFTDSYREFYPDEVLNPGFTWTSGYVDEVSLMRSVPEGEIFDRIDFIYYRSKKLSLKRVEIVGEDAKTSDIVIYPYPSDHRAVAAEFEVKLGLAH